MDDPAAPQASSSPPHVLVVIQEQSLAVSPQEQGQLPQGNGESSSVVVLINVQDEQRCPCLSIASSKRQEIEEKVCRVCHLGSPEVPGELMELACLCKDDLAIAHRQCAEAWFRIRGNRKCEICGKIVTNITLKRGVWSRMARMINPEMEGMDQPRYPHCNAIVTFFTLGILLPLLIRFITSK